MPYLTETTPFTGDNDIEDFLTNVYAPFAEDECKWNASLAPVRDPVVTAPEKELYLCRQDRSGSPLAVDSPLVTQPPYLFLRTTSDGNHLHHFSGTGVADSASPEVPAYDQPGNPMNHGISAGYGAPGAGNTNMHDMRCLFTNDLQGTFDKYWLFCDDEGRYIHCVIKQSARQYRHFHVGLWTPLHPDLDPESFYITGHFWEQLDPTGISGIRATSTPPVNGEHNPYGSNDLWRPFFGNWSVGNETGAGGAIRMQGGGIYIHMPNLVAHSPEIFWFKAAADDEISWGVNNAIPQTDFGDVNKATGAITFGIAQMSGAADGMGAVLFACDKTFTSNAVPLIPIYCGVNNDFAGDTRLGVVAQIPDTYRINMRDIDAEQEIAIGSDTYVCFPVINKDSANVVAGEGYSAFEGIAYKKIDNGEVP